MYCLICGLPIYTSSAICPRHVGYIYNNNHKLIGDLRLEQIGYGAWQSRWVYYGSTE